MAGAGRTEREAKLLAPPDLTLPSFDGLLKGVVATSGPPRHLDAAYYDTDDLLLARSGVTLRHRIGEPGPPWTLKFPERSTASALVRHEIVLEGSDEVPAQAADLIRVYLRQRPLVCVARLRTDRTPIELVDADGTRLAEIVDDVVDVSLPGRAATPFREVEVEVWAEGPRANKLLARAVDRLVRAGCQTGAPQPKVIRALGPDAQAPPEVVGVDIDAGADLGDLVRVAVGRSVSQLMRVDPAVRLGEDPEAVHQFRVATRRLRSDLRTFASWLDPTWTVGLRSELKWLDTRVGSVRDADVLDRRLRTQVAALPEPDQRAGRDLLELLGHQRGGHRRQMLAALRSPRYDALLEALVAAAGQPVFAAEPAEVSLRPAVASDWMGGPWRKLARAATVVDDDTSDQELHRIRIFAKRCRYAADAAEPVVGRPAARFARAIAEVQTLLGDHQDTVVAEDWLRAAASSLPGTALVAGQLIALQRAQRAQLRAGWSRTWVRASAAKRRTWF